MTAAQVNLGTVVTRTDALAEILQLRGWKSDIFEGTLYQGAWIVFESLYRLALMDNRGDSWYRLHAELNKSINQTWPINHFMAANSAVRNVFAMIVASPRQAISSKYRSFSAYLTLMSIDQLKNEYEDNIVLSESVAKVARYATHTGTVLMAGGLAATYLGVPVWVGGAIFVGGVAVQLISEAAQIVADYYINANLDAIAAEAKVRLDRGEWPKDDYNAFFAKFAPGHKP